MDNVLGINLFCYYHMSRKSCTFSCRESLYINGQYFLDIQQEIMIIECKVYTYINIGWEIHMWQKKSQTKTKFSSSYNMYELQLKQMGDFNLTSKKTIVCFVNCINIDFSIE